MTKKKILIIDDDSGIIDVMSIILEDEGYEIKSVDDDNMVFKTVDEFKPDLIFLDVWMPGLGGKEICRRIKEDKNGQKIPIVIVSASVNIEKICKDCGADGFLEKPFEMEMLLLKAKEYSGIKTV